MADTEVRVQITTPDLRALHSTDDIDPDISATLTDFLAFTEHLPSAIVRSMTLIAEQDRIATEFQYKLHDLLATYSKLSTVQERRDVRDNVALRREISHAYQRVERARRMSAAESVRMLDKVQKDQVCLGVICHKLKHMPMPPSRDPTPEPVKSPQVKQSQLVEEKRPAPQPGGAAPRIREKKIVIPGEVLPPPNPESPAPEYSSDEDSVGFMPRSEHKRQKTPGRPRTPNFPRERKEKKDRTPKSHRNRTPGQMGTNVHSQVAGISTSNALLALIAPPTDAVPGSKWLPWKRITEFELAKLRKRMKKNAIWLPSPAMRNRELKNLGRGQQAMEAARHLAAEQATEFVDEFGPDWTDPTKAVLSSSGEPVPVAETVGPEIDNADEDEELMNRGMRLNEAKKRKRERMLEEAAIQAQLETEQRLSDGRLPPEAVMLPIKASPKKRKRDSTPTQAAAVTPSIAVTAPPTTQQPKRLKLTTATLGSTGLQLPLSSGVSAGPIAAGASSTPRITLKRTTKAASAEPPLRRALRRGSVSSLPGDGGSGAKPGPRAGSVDSRTRADKRHSTSGGGLASSADTAGGAAAALAATSAVSVGAGRRRRPAPGLVTADEDGRTKVSVGKRKAAPQRKKSQQQQQQQQQQKKTPGEDEQPAVPAIGEAEPVEMIDPLEPRYCLCGDVSWGTMIACDNEDCDKEWFHLSCVDLKEMPPRRTRWYCPDCRKRLKKGQTTNGIVRL